MEPEINNLGTSRKPQKRVLFVVTQSELGGAQRFLDILATKLDKSKYEILITGGSGSNNNNYELLNKLEQSGLKTRRLKFLKREINLFNDLRAIYEIKKIINDFEPEVLFLLSSKAGFIGSLAVKFLMRSQKPKVIYRIGGWSFNDPRPNWEKTLWKFLEKLSANWKDFIIVNSKADFNQAVELKIKPRKNLILIHNGLDVFKNDYLSKEEARLRLSEKASRRLGKIFQFEKIVGTIANLYPAKGLEFFIDAAEHFKNNDKIIFIIIGDGPEGPKLEKLIKDKGLNKKILLLGNLPDASRLLCAFDIFVLSSIKEGFPWALVEAMAAKLPVIATRVGAVSEIIEDGKNGILLDPGKPEQIADRLHRLLDNDHLQQELGIQAHQTVLFKFPVEKMIREIESVIND